MAELQAYATIDDLETIWRTLKGDESERAEALLSSASNYLRQIARNNGVDLDAKKEEDDTGLYGETLKTVVLNAVQRTMLTPEQAMSGAESYSLGATPYSESMSFSSGVNDVYFKNKELRLLGLGSISGKSQIGIVRGIR